MYAQVLHHTLDTLLLAVGPIVPFLAEEVRRALVPLVARS